ncbi:MAG: phage holin family protein [Gammaproteobacteria bacterium]|nr:phage holin family protein [Gammaproteobacteria bacterium]
MASEVRDPDTGHHGGLFNSVKALAATLLAIGRTRLELLSTEIEEERLRISSMLVWTLVALFCTGLGVMLATLFVVVFFWDTHRLLALGIPALLFLFVAALACAVVIGKGRAKPRPFAASLAELSKDHERLTSRS